ncbi:thiol:disulfide interchange protein [Altererythrobacter xixiisoli]|uniref:Thiol:disulfide interchange protein n=1 Tax=Croceibacterium xixiisoli TaxID=1476466 RepID=A0A6I4TSY3_9SPHN|nr:thioredoxin family protein [Croceibacterium xixiisoli]MXO99255.1 thiol:disulfide interchange protein [Croceibacterium xixiisoli]
MRASFMPFIRAILAILLLAPVLAAAFLPTPASAQMAEQPDRMDRGAASLQVEAPPAPGESTDLALHFIPQPGWHGYWANPGDAGLGMELEWTLPDGWQVDDLRYPLPHRLVLSGLMNHVFEGDYAVLTALRVPASAKPGRYPISVFGRWLICSDTLCVPQQGRLFAEVTVTPASASQASVSQSNAQFDNWRAALPPLLDQQAHFGWTADRLQIAIPLPASLTLAEPHVFIEQTKAVDYAAPQLFRRQGDMLVVEIPRGGLKQQPDAISGMLKLDGAGGGIRFAAQPGEVPAGGEVIAGSASTDATAPLWLLLGGALLGGLVLNLMPCVFPILSLKALTLARAGGQDSGAKADALAYTAGVVLACLALGGLLLALRAGGSEIGWAFQLQEPGVVIALLVLAVLIAANLAGLYELPSLSFTRSGGRQSGFATGLLAAFVATPCTGPFMAAALGAALLLPWWQGLVLFGALGLGLALPFLLLGFVPPLRRMLPKPGKWMDVFRRILAVPMILTAAGLLWLAWRLGGPWFAVLGMVLAGLALLVMILWRRAAMTDGSKPLVLAPIAAALLVAAFLPRAFVPPPAAGDSMLSPVAYDAAGLAAARASGKPVFLWFTADWCLTCKVNEKVAIEREATRDAFERAGVVAMRGDWTVRDAEITRFLTDHGAAGVPLYLWYRPGAEGEQLGQVLTPESLVELADQSRR